MTIAGKLLTVKRSSGGSYDPLDDGITFEAGWWAGDLSLSDGANVTTWADGTGNGNTLNHVSGTVPTYVASDPNYNNRPSVAFNDGNYDNGSTTSPVISQPVSVVVVGEAGTHLDFFIDSNNSSNRCAWYLPSGNHGLYAGGNWYPRSYIAGEAFMAIAVFNNTSSKFRYNGTSYTGGSVGTMGITGFTVGARYSNTYRLTSGNIAFIAVYSGDLLTDSGFSAWETNIRAHYNL